MAENARDHPSPNPFCASSTTCSGKGPAQKQVQVPCITCWEHGQKGRPHKITMQNAGPSCWMHHAPSSLQCLTSPTQVPTQGQ